MDSNAVFKNWYKYKIPKEDIYAEQKLGLVWLKKEKRNNFEQKNLTAEILITQNINLDESHFEPPDRYIDVSTQTTTENKVFVYAINMKWPGFRGRKVQN